MNMFAKSSSNSVKEYLESVPSERQEAINFLHDFIQKSAPSLKPHFATNMIGYGTFEYLDKRAKIYKSWHVVGLANQKNYISVYICAIDGNQYLAEKHKSELGKVTVGRSCISFKKLEDLNLAGLKKVLHAAQSYPGLVGAITK